MAFLVSISIVATNAIFWLYSDSIDYDVTDDSVLDESCKVPFDCVTSFESSTGALPK